MMFEIDKGKVALTVNKDILKTILETRGKILATLSKFSLFCVDLRKERDDAEKELEVLSEGFKPVNDSSILFGNSILD